MATDITYAASLSTSDESPEMLELVVTRNVYAGICGPFIIQEFPQGTDLDDVEAFLRLYQFSTKGLVWTAGRAYNGLRLTTPLQHA